MTRPNKNTKPFSDPQAPPHACVILYNRYIDRVGERVALSRRDGGQKRIDIFVISNRQQKNPRSSSSVAVKPFFDPPTPPHACVSNKIVTLIEWGDRAALSRRAGGQKWFCIFIWPCHSRPIHGQNDAMDKRAPPAPSATDQARRE